MSQSGNVGRAHASCRTPEDVKSLPRFVILRESEATEESTFVIAADGDPRVGVAKCVSLLQPTG